MILEVNEIPHKVEELSIQIWLKYMLQVFICQTCRDILWYGMGICLPVCPSVCWSVQKACKHDTDWTVSATTIKLSTHTTYAKRTNPIDFQGHGSKVKVTCYTLLLNLVNKINPFYIANYNVKSLLNSPVGCILQRWRCSCYSVNVTCLGIGNWLIKSGLRKLIKSSTNSGTPAWEKLTQEIT